VPVGDVGQGAEDPLGRRRDPAAADALPRLAGGTGEERDLRLVVRRRRRRRGPAAGRGEQEDGEREGTPENQGRSPFSSAARRSRRVRTSSAAAGRQRPFWRRFAMTAGL